MCNPTVLAESQNFPQSIAVNLTHIYWTTTTEGVRFCEKDDCAATVGPLAASPAAQSPAATDATVYWMD